MIFVCVSGEAIFRIAEVQKEIQLKFEDCVSVQLLKQINLVCVLHVHLVHFWFT